LADGILVLDCRREFRVLFLRGGEGDVEFVRDHLRHTVTIRVAPTHDAADIAHHALRAKSAKGDDLGDRALTVFLTDVFDDFAAAFHAEIDVDIWRADPLRVEETLEDESVAEGVDISDAQHVGDEGTGGGSTAWANGNASVFGVLDEVPDDEEIADEAGFLDD
jgi:hypothetical protein